MALALLLVASPARADSPAPPSAPAAPVQPPPPAAPAPPASGPPAAPPTPPHRPLYKSGWLWGSAGALVVIVVAGVVAARVSATWANAPDAGPGRAAATLAVHW